MQGNSAIAVLAYPERHLLIRVGKTWIGHYSSISPISYFEALLRLSQSDGVDLLWLAIQIG
jgi:hypothetical protein